MSRKHAYWKRYGYSTTCSNCGHSCLGGNYCQKCGAIMDLPEQSQSLAFLSEIKLPKIINCEYCNKPVTLIEGKLNYCPYCGEVIVTEVEEDGID